MSIDDIPTAAQLRDNLRQCIATLERERDEARDLYQRMRQAVAGDGTYGDASQLLAKWGFVNHPEWRKDGA